MAEKLTSKGKDGTGIHAEVLKSLITQCEGFKADMDEARGELGAKVKHAEDAHGVHRKAFKLAMVLNRMDESSRNDFLRALDDYRKKLGFGAQGDLFAADDADDAGAERPSADDELVRTNLERASGIKELAH